MVLVLFDVVGLVFIDVAFVVVDLMVNVVDVGIVNDVPFVPEQQIM